MKSIFTIFSLFALICWSSLLKAQSWTELDSGVTSHLRKIYFVDEFVGYACGDNGTIIKTVDGGIVWDILNSGTTNTLRDIYFINSDTGFAVGGIADGGKGIVLKTINGGNTWTLTNVCDQIITGVQFVNSNTGFITAGYGCSTGLFETTNMGVTWNSVSNPNSTLWNHGLFFVNDQVGYVVGSYEKVVKTVNGGVSWNGTVNMASPNHLVHGVHFIDENIGFICGYSGIKKTTNGGSSWYQVSSVGGRVNFVTAEIGYFVSGTQLFKSSDVGDTWDTVATFPYIAENLFFINENLGYVCGTQGMIMKLEDGNAVDCNFINNSSSWLTSSDITNASNILDNNLNTNGYLGFIR